MNICYKMLLVGPMAIVLSACGADTESADAGVDHEVAAQAEPATDKPATAPAGEPATNEATAPDSGEPAQATSPDADADGQDDAEAEEEYSTDVLKTPTDAITFWVKSMAKADLYGSLFASDTGSSAYPDLLKHAEMIEEASLSEDPQKRFVVDFLRIYFNDPWKDAEIRLVAEQPPRAQFDVEWTNGRVITIDLNEVEGLWRVLVTTELLKPDASSINENDMPTPPPANP